MNCSDFESDVFGLDRGESPGVEALEHAASCPGCRKELEAIGDLRTTLSALAQHDAATEAPAYLETALLKTLTQSRQPVTAGPAVRLRSATPGFRFAVAAAALILVAIAAAIGFVRWNFVRPNPDAPVAGRPEIKTASPQPGAQKDDSKNSVNPVPVKPERLDQQAGAGGRVAKDREGNKSSRGMKRATARPTGREDFEIATDYFPIDLGSFMQPIDGGQIVRIKLPRSALRSYGLPVDPLRADEAVKADVVLGNDGMARAIRFVR